MFAFVLAQDITTLSGGVMTEQGVSVDSKTCSDDMRCAWHAGKTAIVTGGNSGIGVESVRALASAGARVILTSRSVEAGQKVAQQLKAGGNLKVCLSFLSALLTHRAAVSSERPHKKD